jgi:H/ACA ribonucleoprotein complex subunit 4
MPEHKVLTRSDADTSPGYGKRPSERTVDELLRCSIVCIDKPMGPTSHQVSAWVKELLALEKAGHCGTLDPRVTGVLPVALADATKAVDAVLLSEKEYVGVMVIHRDVDAGKIKETASDFTGEVYQTPPVRAAVKRQLRTRRVSDFSILEIAGRKVLFKVKCESGTYIRTLCNDMGDALGSGAHMADLRRTATAGFGEEGAVTLHELRDRYTWWMENGDEKIREILFPVEKMLDGIPRIYIKDSAVDALCHGANLAVPGIVRLDAGIEKGGTVAIFSLKGEGVALGRALMHSDEMLRADGGFAVDTSRVLMSPGVYPRVWKEQKKCEKGDIKRVR